jgi:hypothetical protein
MPAGRPTDYKPEIIDQINEYLKSAVPENQQIPTIERIALNIGVSRECLYEWARVHPEFSDTLEKVRAQQKDLLMQTGIFGGKEVNATIIALLLKVNHDMIETTREEHTGKDGKDLFPTPIAEINVSKNDSVQETKPTN